MRIPKEMKFETNEVLLRREGERLIIEPKAGTLKDLSARMGEAIDWDWSPEDSKTKPEQRF